MQTQDDYEICVHNTKCSYCKLGSVVVFVNLVVLAWILSLVFQSHVTSGFWSLLLIYPIFSLYFVLEQYYSRKSSEYYLLNSFEPQLIDSSEEIQFYPFIFIFFSVVGSILSIICCAFFFGTAFDALVYDYSIIWSDNFLSGLITLILTFSLSYGVLIYISLLREGYSHKFQDMGFIKKTFVICIFIIFIVLISLSTYQVVMSSLKDKYVPKNGELIWVQTNNSILHREHIYCINYGPNKNGPTVLLFHGLGGQALDFGWIQPVIANHTKTCSFDRAGYGFSDVGSKPRISSTFALELDILLEKANLTNDEFILVGHSMAGYNMRVFYRQTKCKVLGIVCIDCVDPREEKIIGFDKHQSLWIDFYFYGRILLPSGIMRVLADANSIPGNSSYIIDSLPLKVRYAYLQNILVDKIYDTQINEWYNFPISAIEANRTGSLGSLPFIVIAAGHGLNNTHLVRLSSNSMLVYLPECTHYLMFHKQWADIVNEKIIWLLNNVSSMEVN